MSRFDSAKRASQCDVSGSLEQVGLPRLRFHDLRHASATVQLALGVDARTVMETLGRSQIGVMMNVRAGVLDELKETAAKRLDAAAFSA